MEKKPIIVKVHGQYYTPVQDNPKAVTNCFMCALLKYCWREHYWYCYAVELTEHHFIKASKPRNLDEFDVREA